MQGRASRVFNVAALVVGGAALAIVLDRLGWRGMRRAIVGTGWWFAAIAVIDLASVMCDAFAIHGFLRPRATISYWHVFAAQASGLAINRLTPGNSLGEPVKVTMLVAHVPASLAVSAVASFLLTSAYLGIAVLVIGVPITASMLDLPPRLAAAVWVAIPVLVASGVAIAVVVQRGAGGTLVDAAAGIRLISTERAARWRAKLVAIDARLRDLGDARASGLARGFSGVAGSRVLNWTGTIVVLHAVAIPLTAPLVVATMSVGFLVTWISNVIPLGLGLSDGGNYLLYDLLGASPGAGLLFAMVNRLRTCVLAIIGLAVMAVARILGAPK